jgi:hypothetical protein
MGEMGWVKWDQTCQTMIGQPQLPVKLPSSKLQRSSEKCDSDAAVVDLHFLPACMHGLLHNYICSNQDFQSGQSLLSCWNYTIIAGYGCYLNI